MVPLLTSRYDNMPRSRIPTRCRTSGAETGHRGRAPSRRPQDRAHEQGRCSSRHRHHRARLRRRSLTTWCGDDRRRSSSTWKCSRTCASRSSSRSYSAEADRRSGLPRSSTCCARPSTSLPALEILSIPHIEIEPGARSSTPSADNAAYGGHGDTAASPVTARPDRRAVGTRPCSIATATIEESGVAAGGAEPPRQRVWPGWRTSSHQHGDRLEAGEIVLGRVVHTARCGWSGATTVLCRLRTDGNHHMSLRLTPTFRDRLGGRSPNAAEGSRSTCGHLGVFGQSARRRDLRRGRAWTGCSSIWSTLPTASSPPSRSCRR